MRVALISAAFPPHDSPEADHVLHLCIHLAQAGCEIDVLTTEGNGVKTLPPSVRVHAIMKDWGWRETGRMAKWLRQVKPDAVTLFYLGWLYRFHPMVTFASALSKRLWPGVPFVTQFPNVFGSKPEFTRRGRFIRRAAELISGGGDAEFGTLLRDSEVIIIFSEHHGKIITHRDATVASKLTLLPPPPILNLSLSDEATRLRARRSLGVKENELLIGYFGQIYPSKGVETLIEAFKLLCDTGVDCRLAVVGRLRAEPLPGGDTYDKYMLRLADQTGYGNRVVFTGAYDAETDIGSTHLRALDICVLPFDNGAQLNNSSLAAAVNHGLPVVTTRGLEPESPFVDGANMLLCRPKDPLDMMQAIRRLTVDEKLRHKLAEGSKQLAQKWFSWERAIDRTLKALAGKSDSATNAGQDGASIRRMAEDAPKTANLKSGAVQPVNTG